MSLSPLASTHEKSQIANLVLQYRTRETQLATPLDLAKAVATTYHLYEEEVFAVITDLLREGRLPLEHGRIRVERAPQSETTDATQPEQGWQLFRRLIPYYLACLRFENSMLCAVPLEDFGTKAVMLRDARDWYPKDHTGFLSFSWFRWIKWKSEEHYRELKPTEHQVSLGYPVCVRRVKDAQGVTRLSAEPVFFWRLVVTYSPKPARGFNCSLLFPTDMPEINPAWLRAMCPTKAKEVAFLKRCGDVEENLFEDGEDHQTRVAWNDWSVQRLAMIVAEHFPEAVQEHLNPDAILTEDLPHDAPEGYYNRAMLFNEEPSPFTRRLERELRTIAQARDEDLDKTALRPLFKLPSVAPVNKTPLAPHLIHDVLSVEPFTFTQREAVSSMLTEPLTVMQGPPGTGKSQVLVGAMLNLNARSQTVLVSANMHKALDAIEERLAKDQQTIGDYPFMRIAAKPQPNTRVGSVASMMTPGMLQKISELLPRQARAMEQATRDRLSIATTRVEHETEALRKVENRAQRYVHLTNQLNEAHHRLSLLRVQPVSDLSEVGTLSLDVPQLAKGYSASTLNAFEEALTRWGVGGLSRMAYHLRHPLVSRALKKWSRRFVSEKEAAPLSWRRRSEAEVTRTLSQGVRLAQQYLNTQKAIGQLSAQRSEQPGNPDLYAQQLAEHDQNIIEALPTVIPLQNDERLHRTVAGKIPLLSVKLKLNDASQVLSPKTFLDLCSGDWNASFDFFLHAFPAWGVSALSVGRAFPLKAALFDMVMVDETSQMNIAQAIPLLFRAKRAAIIGDPAQLAFISVLSDYQEQKLRERAGLVRPTDAQYCYSKVSLYDFAHQRKAASRVFLGDTFRSAAPITAYCSEYFYEGNLRTATNEAALKVPDGWPRGIQWIPVEGPVLRGEDNTSCYAPDEVRMVVQVVRKLLLEDGYQGTVGVVTPFAYQGRVIQATVQRSLPAEVLQRANFVAATAHAFQGGERDVMIMSLCSGEQMPQGCRRFLNDQPSIFNVAISRAKALLIVVGNKTWAKHSGIHFIEGLTEDWQNAPDLKLGTADALYARLEEQLLAQGLPVQRERKDHGRFVSLAIEDPQNPTPVKIAVMVSGPTTVPFQPRPWYWLDADLVRYGWQIVRLWPFEVEENLDDSVDRIVSLWRRLHEKEGDGLSLM